MTWDTWILLVWRNFVGSSASRPMKKECPSSIMSRISGVYFVRTHFISYGASIQPSCIDLRIGLRRPRVGKNEHWMSLWNLHSNAYVGKVLVEKSRIQQSRRQLRWSPVWSRVPLSWVVHSTGVSLSKRINYPYLSFLKGMGMSSGIFPKFIPYGSMLWNSTLNLEKDLRGVKLVSFFRLTTREYIAVDLRVTQNLEWVGLDDMLLTDLLHSLNVSISLRSYRNVNGE